ncbi:uncharacterized protein LOC108604133 [Drosophila busckii]|uniref:uncharacterized protein LOC108604133 n=1 Tax=Drosophila busckii TaxID=30019 RepID=UPI00083EA0C0|nr:uncharacterized protein LOC108604133 [Drosophila busckii]
MSCGRKTKLWEPQDAPDMRTTTQLMLEEGSRPQRTKCTTEYKLVNFQSFNMDDPRYGTVRLEDTFEPPLRSSYMREFSQPYPNRCKPLQPKVDSPDFMFNRMPKNEFDSKTGLDYKFLDDHMLHVPQSRKTVNFFRQLRNQSYIVY